MFLYSIMDSHDLIRPGSSLDLYYYDADTSKKQAFPVTFNTRYIQNFQNLTGGSQVFTIPPTNGISDVLISMAYNNTGSSPGAIALPRAWGYALINRVSFRYGGSSQYFLTGDQLLQLALRAQPSQTSADAILTLGGNYATGADLVGIENATVVLTLPHNWPSGCGKKNPFPSDLLTQQIQITVELNAPNSIWTNQTGSALPSFCSTLSSGSFQVAQLMLNNQGDCLARRHDMSVSAYAFPAEFAQQIVRVPLISSANSQSVVLTGFRAGGLKTIQFWLTRGADTSSTTTGYNPFRWYLPSSLTVQYAGQVYSRFENGSSSLWGLVNGAKPPAVNNVVVTGAGSAITTTSELSNWVDAPFAQPLVDEDSHNILINGMAITNGVINVDITTPSAQSDWVLNCSYIYNTTILFSQGTCDLIF